MTRRIARLGWADPLPTPDQASRCGLQQWLLPLRCGADGQLEWAVHPDRLLQELPGHAFALEWQQSTPLTPRQERALGEQLKPWLRHEQALRLSGRATLWIHDPQTLSHPRFLQQRLQLAVEATLLLMAAGPPAHPCFEAVYERSDWIPCQRLGQHTRNYESYLFHAHHRPVGETDLVVPCITAMPSETSTPVCTAHYREWEALSSAWSSLRHPEPSQRLVLIEHWPSHLACQNTVAPNSATPSQNAKLPHCSELKWGSPESHNPALLIHGYHLDVLETQLAPLAATTPDLDLYVSTPLTQMHSVAELLRQQGWPRVQLVGCPNIGRDQAAFLLELLPRARRQGHPWAVKLHTKRSAQTPGGERWGQQLWQQLASPAGLAQLRALFAADRGLAVVLPEGSLLPTTVCLARNEQHLQDLLATLQIDPRWWLSRPFAAGSFWAARLHALDPLLALNLSWRHFESEAGHVDGTLAHALERLIPALPEHHGGGVLQLQANEPVLQPGYGHPWAHPD